MMRPLAPAAPPRHRRMRKAQSEELVKKRSIVDEPALGQLTTAGEAVNILSA